MSRHLREKAPTGQWARQVVVALVLAFVFAVAEAPLTRAAPPTILNDLPDAQPDALRLVMVAFPGCPFCLKWDQQVGVDYGHDALGKTAPLVRVLFGSKSLARYKTIKYTPTFLLLRGEQEVGRIAGYPGRDAFWDELHEVLEKAGQETASQREGQALTP